jgi:hypothetical protein
MILQRPVLELADVVRKFRDLFEDNHHPLKQHKRVLNAIDKCRTAALGGHVDACERCGHQRISYNSCRNRHCPKCQGTNRERWILQRQDDLLPVSYFHIVFTLPEQLNCYCLRFPKAMYNMLFEAGHDTLTKLGKDEKQLGATTGMISVLHTWGQNLSLHPHIHCIVPGGGISKAGHWKACRNKGKYLFPVKVMSAIFRGKFMELFKLFCKNENVDVPQQVIHSLYATAWVVYAKQPFMGPQQVIEYLGRYTHRIAISNHRIISICNTHVTFSYKDYKHGGKQSSMTLDGCEFLRRFCLHILPPGFRKIRHYGFLSNRAKPNLKLQQMKMGVSIIKKEKRSWQQITKQQLGFDVELCPQCKTGRMVTVHYFDAHAPPGTTKFEWMNPHQ